jgi:hypothetical protein
MSNDKWKMDFAILLVGLRHSLTSVASQLILYNGGTCSMMTAAVDNYMGRDSSDPHPI